jgi:hypothetical protein
MKTTHLVEVGRGTTKMKPEIPIPPKPAAGRRSRGSGMPHLPMEWMDPMSWRLPSGMALAEFALQTGFLAPLMIRAPQLKKKTPAAGSQPREAGGIHTGGSRKPAEEAPGRKASFWQTR